MLRKVRLVEGAKDKAREANIDVAFLSDDDPARTRDADGNEIDFNAAGNEVVVRGREYHLLKLHGLIEEGSVEPVAPAATQPEMNQAAEGGRQREREVLIAQRTGTGLPGGLKAKFPESLDNLNPERGPQGTDSRADPGGAGHLRNDGYGNDRVQGEVSRDQMRGALRRAEEGLGAAADEYRGVMYDDEGNEMGPADLRAREARQHADALREQRERVQADADAAEQSAKEQEQAAEKQAKEREKAEKQAKEREQAKDRAKETEGDRKEREAREAEEKERQKAQEKEAADREKAEKQAKDQREAKDQDQQAKDQSQTKPAGRKGSR